MLYICRTEKDAYGIWNGKQNTRNVWKRRGIATTGRKILDGHPMINYADSELKRIGN
jgi:hypothetical protein